jgi:hypothetical protein
MNTQTRVGRIGLRCGDAGDALAHLRLEALQRRIRRSLFDGAISQGPPWAMLLELYLARRAQRTLRTMELLRMAGVSEATGSRYLAALSACGLVTRSPDPGDGRVSLVRMTACGAARIELYAAVLLAAYRTGEGADIDHFAGPFALPAPRRA